MLKWLSGAGGVTLANALVFSLAFELWSDGILRFEARPDFEFVGLPAFGFGAAVAIATSGWRGLAVVVALASLWAVMVPFIPGADRDFFLRQLWNYAGIALGVLIAVARRRRFSSGALAGIGVFVALQAPVAGVVAPVLCYSGNVPRCVEVVQVLTIAWGVIAGAVAGVVLARVTSSGATIAVALILALPSALIVAHQGWMARYDAGALLSLAGMANGILASVAVVLAAEVVRRTTGTRGSGALG